MFEKSLQDLVKGIRGARGNEESYIAKAVADIKKELAEHDTHVKSQALQKLIYLHMLGHDMSWAAFHVVEVMSQPWYGHKRVAYLAAAQSFHEETDVILLTTHLFRKAFSQGSGTGASHDGMQYEVASAINCLANVITKDLARDLISDIYGMMNSSKPYIRKKAVLVLLNVFHKWPKALRLSFDRLKEKLSDPDPGVVSAAVYVVCELAKRNPKNYLKLAPLFFNILTSSSNNWVLIKVVKLMGSLVPLEPRLAKKLTAPLTDIIEVTPAKSLLYECVNTLLSGELTSKAVVMLCLDKLKSFIEDHDQNLKYLGLLGLHKLMKQHPRAVDEHRDVILDCLGDEDVTIRMRALDLITSMVSKKNIKSVVRKLCDHIEVADGQYRHIVLTRVLDICSQEHYSFVTDFEWYIDTLVELTHVEGASVQNARRINDHLMDVAIRVDGVRPFMVRSMVDLLLDGRLLGCSVEHHDAPLGSDAAASAAAPHRARGLVDSSNAMTEVLFAAAWIVGEFAALDRNHHELLTAMLSPEVAALSPTVQNVFVQNVTKVYIAGLLRKHEGPSGGGSDDINGPGPLSFTTWRQNAIDMTDTVLNQLPLFSRSPHVEVQERAVSYLAFIQWLAIKSGLRTADDIKSAERAEEKKAGDVGAVDLLAQTTSVEKVLDLEKQHDEVLQLLSEFSALFGDLLNPVSADAQSMVSVPGGLDLDAWINDPPEDDDLVDTVGGDDFWSSGNGSAGASNGNSYESYDSPLVQSSPKVLTPAQLELAQKARERNAARRAHDPYYIGGGSGAASPREDVVNVDDIPIKRADFDLPPMEVHTEPQGRHRTRQSRGFSEEDIHESKQYTVRMVGDAPKAAPKAAADTDKKKKKKKKKGDEDDSDDDLGAVDLSEPLDSSEMIQTPQTYAARDAEEKKRSKEKEKEKDKKKKDKKDKKSKKGKKHKQEDDASQEQPAASGAAGAGPSVLDLFDPVVSSATAAPQAEVQDADKEKKHKHKHKHKSKHKSKESDAEEAEAKSGSHKHPHGVHPVRICTLYKDAILSVKYFTRTDSHDKGSKAYVELWAEAGTPAKQSATDAALASALAAPLANTSGVVKNLRLRIKSSNLCRVKGENQFLLPPLTVPAAANSASVSAHVTADLQIAKLSAPERMDVEVSYSFGSGDAVNATKQLEIPLSSLVHAAKLSLPEVQELLSTPGACSALSSATLRLEENSVHDALKLVTKILNVRLVEAVSFTATFYGLSVQGDHVAVLVKARKEEVSSENPSVSVDIKTPRQVLSDALLVELQRLLR